MEFNFDCETIFHQGSLNVPQTNSGGILAIVEGGNNALISNRGMQAVIGGMGEASARAQKLGAVITTPQKLHMCAGD